MVYVDTSALAKWYVSEPYSDDFELFISAHRGAWVSTLTSTELRCLLARRRRRRELTAAAEMQVFAAFEHDVEMMHLRSWPVEDRHLVLARHIIDMVPGVALRTLDAIHLAVARALGADRLATADRIQADAAEALGLEVVRFHGS